MLSPGPRTENWSLGREEEVGSREERFSRISGAELAFSRGTPAKDVVCVGVQVSQNDDNVPEGGISVDESVIV